MDEAVADAYGWGDDWRAGLLTDTEILGRCSGSIRSGVAAAKHQGASMAQNVSWTPVGLGPLVIGAFAWQVHGVWVGVGLAALNFIILLASNFFILFAADDAGDDYMRPFKRLQLLKWLIIIVFMVGISLSGADTGSTR